MDGHIGNQDEIEVPVVYIQDDWSVDDLESIDDCEDAFIVLMSSVAAIEARIEEMTAGRVSDHNLGRTRGALRWKKTALAMVNTKKGAITRKERKDLEMTRDKMVLAYIGAEHPELIRTADIWASSTIARRNAEAK